MRREEVDEILVSEISKIAQPDLITTIESRRITPRSEIRDWDYSPKDAQYECWVCVEDISSKSCVAYCQEGFGPTYPWGLLELHGDNASLGMDAQWYRTLEDAVRAASFWAGINPIGYEAG
jgi:hypothetical protein